MYVFVCNYWSINNYIYYMLNVYDKFKLVIVSENQEKIEVIYRNRWAPGMRLLLVTSYKVPKCNNVHGAKSGYTFKQIKQSTRNT